MVKNKNVRKTGLKSENMDNILEVLYERPQESFTIREIEKITKIPRTTVSEYLRIMNKKNLLNKESLIFKIKKINYFTEKIVSSGLIDYIIEELNPSCIILFGSIRKGESDKESDIDLFVETHINKKIKLEKYERTLKHKVSLFIENKIGDLPENLFNNVVNGIKLYGSFKAKC